MKNFNYSIGYKFYNLEVISSQFYKNKEIYIKCKCVCGNIRDVRARDINKHHRQSCGCKQKELVAKALRKGTLANNGYKICSICKISKLISDFKPSGYTKDKLKQFCIRCGKDLELQQKYGISIEVYESWLSKQNGKCACCGSLNAFTPKSSRGNFVVDHCHVTGKIRGLLCFNCNTAIGKLGDVSVGVFKAYEYLRRFESDCQRSDSERGEVLPV